MTAYGIKLNGTYISGGGTDENPELWAETSMADGCEDAIVVGCMTANPDGLGLPGMRTEDITFTQRDGVKHFNDWYEPRTITIDKVMVCPDNCGGEDGCSVRERVQHLIQAWKRTCCDTELVVYTDCSTQVYDDYPAIDPGLEVIRTNFVRDPSAQADPTVDWTADTNAIVTRSLTEAWVGTASIRNEVAALGTSSSFGSPTGLDGFAIEELTDYIASVYVMVDPLVVATATIALSWYDDTGVLVGVTTTGASAVVTGAWGRISVTATSPATAAYGRIEVTFNNAALPAGSFFYADGFLLEEGTVLLDWFDGNTEDTDTFVVGGTKVVNTWGSTIDASESLQVIDTYVAGPNLELNGPFGVVGRPRVATMNWRGKGSHCAEVLLRFDAVDHRMYVLNQCGTPGFQNCVQITPGVETLVACYTDGVMCYEDGTVCYSQPVEGGIAPEIPDINIGGTEKVFPTITLYPNMLNPRIVNVLTGEFIAYSGLVTDHPVVINTENGTAYSNGESVTHRLSGNIFLELYPGNYELRLFQTGDYPEDPAAENDLGYMQVCWRDTVVMA
jgi:hypothetical protein